MVVKHRPWSLSSLFLLSLFQLARGQGDCPRGEGKIAFVGASTLELLSSSWAEAWGCQTVTTESGGSSAGLARVCGTSQVDTGFSDIGGMTRDPFPSEAGTQDGYNYKCERSARSLIGIEVAVEGVSLAVPQSKDKEENVAAKCLEQIEALTLPQLRWIFSSFSDDELAEDGWDADSIPFSDGNTSTHLWSEIDPSCEAREIVIAGPPLDSESARLFKELVFGEQSSENFDVQRPGSFFTPRDEDELADFLATNNAAAIAYFDIGYILTRLDLEATSLVSIQSEDHIIKPSAKALEDGFYPLSRILHYFLLNDEDSLENTRAFVEFIFSEKGDEVTKSVGYWPLAASKKLVMATRIQSESGIPRNVIESYCGPKGASISIAGSSTVFPIADLWSKIYSTFCEVDITVEGGGSSNGSGRLCAEESRGTPVIIGDMSREWKDSEATEHYGFLYECIIGDTSRSAIQIEVAIDGLTVAVTQNGVASTCIQLLGGLTTDQLRWIYSSYKEDELEATGWDPASVPNSDGNSQTHKWNELHPSCADVEIRIAGAGDQSGTYDYFLETILLDHENGETFDTLRPLSSYYPSEDDDELVDYIFTFPQALSFFGYNYYFENQESLESVAIRNRDGVFLKPTTETIDDGSYNPLSRRLYMNLLNSASDLQNTAPFVKFGLENPILVTATGYVAIPEEYADRMIATRLEEAPHEIPTEDQSNTLSGGAIAGIVVGSVIGLFLVLALVMWCMRRGSSKGELQETSR